MDEKNVKVLASLLNTEDEKVKTAVENDGGLVDLVNDFKTNNQIFNATDFAKLKDNFRRETIETLTEDDIPKEFKNKAVGWKLESIEKEIKEEYGYDGSYDNLRDLVKNVVEQAKDGKDDDEALKENKILKDRIVAMEKEKDEAVRNAKSNFDQRLVELDFDRALNNIGLDYEEGDALAKQRDLLAMSFKGSVKLQRKGDNTVMIGEDGKPITDNKLDPVPLEEGLADFAKTYGFQLKEEDTAGQGGSSSTKPNTEIVGTTFAEYRESKGVEASTEEADELFKEWREANPQ